MGEKARVWFSASERADLWERWKGGQCVADIARSLERRNKSGVYKILAASGGITPRPRERAAAALTLEEREEISRGVAAGRSIRRIAAGLGRCPSTVSRELKRNGGAGSYRANEAELCAWDRARRPKPCRLARHPELRWRVAEKLARQWSPEQISGWLKEEFGSEKEMQISHETIYKSLFVQARGVLKKKLMVHLRTRRQLRQAKGGATKRGLGSIVDAISIRERPAEADDRAVPGHWEGDLLSGAKNTHIATLVERHTRFVMLIKLEGKDTTSVVEALARQVRKLPTELRRSLTWDRGKEMADHKRFTLATDVKVYFCDPRSPWQRGSNENTNGLLRQYFPKRTDLSAFSQTYLNRIAQRLNERPRKTLGFKCPADRLRAVLQ
jgi:IS30 family transposase